jgi:hypothetical protein
MADVRLWESWPALVEESDAILDVVDDAIVFVEVLRRWSEPVYDWLARRVSCRRGR